MLPEFPLPCVQPADSPAYDRSYWQWVDQHVLATKTGGWGSRRLPRHFELGLDGTHRILPSSQRLTWHDRWQERSPWLDVAFFALFIALLVLGILFAGGKLEIGF